MKINRLLEIALILLNKGQTTAKELAERFDVSTRTIYRDIDILSTAGIPVYTSKGNGGGISLLENYSISRTMLTDDEKDSLLLALKTLQATKYPEVESMLDKLSGVFQNKTTTGVTDWVDIDFMPWGSGPNAENRLVLIKQAILSSRVIVFDYINASGIRSRRTVEPLQLKFKGQAWYLNAYCRMRGELRMFRLSRMKNMELTEESFVRREFAESDIDQTEVNVKAPVTLKLRFQPEDLFRVMDDYDDEYIIRNEDGTYDVSVTFPEDEWVYGYIMSFGNYVEVLSPPHIRKIIAARMRKALKYYR